MSEAAVETAQLESSDDALQQAPVVQVGAQLRAAREAAGLELAALARLLRLGERQVEALEQGDWSRLPGNTFVRGFVRNYARAVNLDAVPLLAQLDRVSELSAPSLDLPESTHVAMPNQSRALNKDALTVAAGLVLVLGAVAAYFFLPDRFWVSTPAATVATTPEPVVTKPTPGEPLFPPATDAMAGAGESSVTPAAAPVTVAPIADTPAPVAPVVPAPQVSAPAQSAVPAPVAAPVASPLAPAAGGAAVSFKFERDSWIEVRDKDGNLLTSRLHPAGSTREVSGTPPLSLVVGNASHVQLQYKGKAVALEPNAESDVARLTLQ